MQNQPATVLNFPRELFLLRHVLWTIEMTQDIATRNCQAQVAEGYNSLWSQGSGYLGNWTASGLPNNDALCRHRVFCLVTYVRPLFVSKIYLLQNWWRYATFHHQTAKSSLHRSKAKPWLTLIECHIVPSTIPDIAPAPATWLHRTHC